LLTNDEHSSILLGVTRDAVIRVARDLGYRVEVGVIRLDDLYAADEAFFTGTAAEVTPIRELNDTPLSNGARGPVTQEIQQRFFDAVLGREPRYRDWLHPVGKPAPLGV
jgi:branched-chain amino acid aminotransferase